MDEDGMHNHPASDDLTTHNHSDHKNAGLNKMAAYLVNRYLLTRGKGHALVMKYHHVHSH